MTQYQNFEVVTSHINGVDGGICPISDSEKSWLNDNSLKTENHFWACSAGIRQAILTDPKAATQTSDINIHILAANLDRRRGCSSQARDFLRRQA